MPDKPTAAKLNYDVELMSRIVNQLLLVARLETLSIAQNETVDLSVIATDVAANPAPLAIASGAAQSRTSMARSWCAPMPSAARGPEQPGRERPDPHVAGDHRQHPPDAGARGRGPRFRPRAVDQRSQMFERFWKGDRNGKGAGLGLAIVKHIMSALHGSVSVGDNPCGGAFTLRFPARV